LIKKTLTVAGSDASGGAGIQADLKTFQEYGTFGFTAVTCIVTMDPDNNWAHNVTNISPEIVKNQLKTIFSAGPVDAMKTGMLGTIEAINHTREFIDIHHQKNIVIDPVMACKGTDELLQPENVAELKKRLIPLATVVTPNLLEAGILSELGTLTSVDDMIAAAKKIKDLGPETVVVKGGKAFHSDQAVDVFFDGKDVTVLKSKKISTHNNHGAGCTFAAAVTAGLAKGMTPQTAVETAKQFVTAAIKNGVDIYPYVGHIWHGAYNEAEKRMTKN